MAIPIRSRPVFVSKISSIVWLTFRMTTVMLEVKLDMWFCGQDRLGTFLILILPEVDFSKSCSLGEMFAEVVVSIGVFLVLIVSFLYSGIFSDCASHDKEHHGLWSYYFWKLRKAHLVPV